MFALAHDRGARENDRENVDVLDDAHHADEP